MICMDSTHSPFNPDDMPLVSSAKSVEMSALLAEQRDVKATLEQLLPDARRATFGDEAAIVLVADEKVLGTAASERTVALADALQLELDQGPSLQAIRSESDFVSSDLRIDRRWPQWGPRAAELGWMSIVSKRLAIGGLTFGSLSLYSHTVAAFEQEDLDVAEFFARYASSALAAARERDALLLASDARHLIGIAEGILMQRHALNAEGAFTNLRLRSQDSHTTLLGAAQQVARDHSH
jgi:GAF domain-containing protein